jgi:hypothetical protein
LPFQPIPRRASTIRAADPGVCPFPLLFRCGSPRGPDRPCNGSGRMPFATALRTDSAPTSSPTPETSRLPCPWRLRESETNSRSRVPSSSLRPPPAPPLRGGAYAPLRFDIVDGFGSGRERPSPRIGSHRMPRPASTLDSRSHRSRQTDTSASQGGWKHRLKLRRARSQPIHPRTRDAIRAARALDPTARVSTLPPMVTRRDRWVEITCEEACNTGPCATP